MNGSGLGWLRFRRGDATERSSASWSLAVALLLIAGSSSAHAETQDPAPRAYPTLGPSDIEFRHFAGRRYVTVAATRVQREPVSTARILADIPRLHVVYADPTADDGWLAVRGAGASAYPDFDEAASFVDFVDGRLRLPALEDIGRYVSLIGFIPRSAVVDLDRAPDAAPAMTGLTPVPPLWEKLGLPEPRQFATDLNAPPFDAIGRLSSRGGYCTAFFVARDVVVTAGHCIPDRPPYQLTVTIERGPGHRDVVAGALVDARRLTDSRGPGDDWAVVNLRRAPRLPITPLHFHRGDEFLGRAAVPVTMLGYPADLRAVSGKVLGFNAPSVSTCVALLPEARAIVSGDGERLALRLHAPCITFPGESGGPLLVWSAARSRWEVVGITSTYRDHDSIIPVFSLSTSAAVRDFASGLASEYGAPPIAAGLGFNATLREDTPGAALLSSLLPTFGAGQPWANFPLSTSLAVAVGQATGHVPKMPVAALRQPGAAVRLSGPSSAAPLTATEMATARALCALRCAAAQLDATTPDRATIGARMPVAGADLPPVAGFTKWRWRIAGGDLFAADPESSVVRAVARNLMNLVERGEDAMWDARFACRCEKEATIASLPRVGPTAPTAVRGGTVLAPRDVAAMRASDAGPAILLTAGAAILRIPGSLDVAFASAAQAGDDEPQRRLERLLAARLGSDRQRAVVAYGDEDASESGYNVAARLIALGYRHVIWMREGVAGWAAAGLDLTLRPD